ncbi:MAG TPA: hypothetical protein DCX46_00750 [Bacteroidetes bacterium]|nr:hypothetical protein [Bacteroidota bacterium]
MTRKLLILLLLAFVAFPASAQDAKENADFKLALNLFQDKFFDLALDQFQLFVNFYPNTQQGIEARYYVARSQFELKRYDEARYSFQNFALSYPDHTRSPEAWMRSGEALVALKNLREAALTYERVRTFHPRSQQAPQALRIAADLFEQLGDKPNAVRVLRLLLQEYGSPDFLPSRIRYAELLLDAGQLDQASQECRRVLEGTQDPASRSRALVLSARVSVALGRSREAVTSLQEVIQKYRTSASYHDALFFLGSARESGGNLRDAAAAWRSIIDDSVRSAPGIRQEAAVRLGDVAIALRDLSGARRAYETASRIDAPLQNLAAFKAGRLSEHTGDTTAAGRWYERAWTDTSRATDRRSAMIAGIKAARWLHRPDETARRAEAFAAAYPDDPVTPRVLLIAAEAVEYEMHDPTGARELYRRVMTHRNAGPIADRAVLGAARSAREFGSWDEARNLFSQVSTAYPASAIRQDAERELEEMVRFEILDREAGMEQLALLMGDVIGDQPRAMMAFRLGEISFTQLKNYPLAFDQYTRALVTGLDAAVQPQARWKAGLSAEYLSLKPGRTAAERSASLREAESAYDSLVRRHPEHPLADEAWSHLIALRSRRVTSSSEVRAVEKMIDSARTSAKVRESLLAALMNAAAAAKLRNDAERLAGRLLVSAASATVRGEAMGRLGLFLAARGEDDSAIVVLREFFDANAGHRLMPEAGSALARLSAKRGDVATVQSVTERLLSSFPYAIDPLDMLLFRADAAFAAHQDAAAADLYEQYRSALESDPLVVRSAGLDVIYRSAVAHHRSGRRQTAERLFGEVIAGERSPEILLNAYTLLASLAESRNDLPGASAYMQEAARLAASSGGSSFGVALESADLLFRNEQYADAAAKYSELLKGITADSLVTYIESRIIVSYLRMDNVSEADRRISAFVKKHPRAEVSVAEFELERGRHMLRKDRADQARVRFDLVVRRYPRTPSAAEAWYWLGRTYELDQDLPRAAQIYDSVLQRYPNDAITPRLKLTLGNVYYTLEQWDKASPLFKSILDDEERSPELVQYAMNNLILTYKELGLYDGALQLTRTYIERFPDDPELINKRIDIGVLYQKLGYYDQSIVHLQNLMSTAGSDLEAELRYYIGESYYYKGDYQQGILEFLKVPYLVTRRGPVDWVATSYYMAGQSYEKMSRFDQAVAMYRQILERAGIDATFKTAAQREIDRVNQLTGKKN